MAPDNPHYSVKEQLELNVSSKDQDTDGSGRSLLRGDQYGRLNKSVRMKVDQDELSRITADAGLNIFGCIFLEVWVLNKTRTRLIRPLGGALMDTAFRGSLPSDEFLLVADYLLSEAPDAASGVGLAGTIFAESSDKKVQWR
jgi:hypothetical protein